MNRIGHFLYTHKLFILNIFLAGFIALLDPRMLHVLPDSAEASYYMGVSLMAILFLEFASIHYLGRFIYSFNRNLQRKLPWYIGMSFIPRVLVSVGLGMLVLDAMGVLTISDFFLVLIIFYATAKEFWVRSFLLNANRSKTKRPSKFMNWTTAIAFFLFLCAAYFSLWEIYLLEHQRVMFLYLAPINWALDILIFAVVVVALEIPFLYEEWTRNKTRAQKVLALSSLLLPVLAFVFNLYRMKYL